jgi:rhodanese-related sulfurtransferase
MKKFWILMLMALLLLPTISVVAQDDSVTARVMEFGSNLPKGYGALKLADFNALLAERDDLVLLDVREEAEYSAGHIENSFNVPIRSLGQNLALLPKTDATIVVICKSGGRAALATASLYALGYTDVKILSGGFDGWAAEELPVSTEPFTVETGEAPAFDPALVAAVDGFLSTLPEGYGFVSSADLAVELVEKPLFLLDVRTPEEVTKDGYIEGSQNVWVNELVNNFSSLPEDKDAAIVVYCAAGTRGAYAKVMLGLMGYTNVRNLAGGLNGWKVAQLPVIGGFILSDVLAAFVAEMPDTFNALRPDDLKAELDADAELILVDVRTADEYAEGHIEGALNIPLQELTSHFDLLPVTDAAIVVYCGSGHRSAIAMSAMNLLGYTNTRSLMTGVTGWTAKEYPLVQTTVEAAAGAAPTFDANVFAVVNNFITSIPAGYWAVKPADLSVELIENPPYLLDVRTDGELADGRIEGAVAIPLRDLFARFGELPTDKAAPVVVYDNPTHRSSIALVALKMLGYENVRVLAGGVGAWTKAELPLVQN